MIKVYNLQLIILSQAFKAGHVEYYEAPVNAQLTINYALNELPRQYAASVHQQKWHSY